MSGPNTRSRIASANKNSTDMGKVDPPSLPNKPSDPTLADLFVEFKKKQEGNTRIETKLNDIEKKADKNAASLNSHIAQYNEDLDDIKTKYDSADTKLTEVEDRLDDLTKRFMELDAENMLLRERLYQVEKDTKLCLGRDDDQKRQNILVQGIPESPSKKTKTDVTELLDYLGIKVSSATVVNIHRVGPKPKSPNRIRHVKVKFSSTLSKQELFKNIAKLKDSEKCKKIGISDD